jgi:hypothetical protein
LLLCVAWALAPRDNFVILILIDRKLFVNFPSRNDRSTGCVDLVAPDQLIFFTDDMALSVVCYGYHSWYKKFSRYSFYSGVDNKMTIGFWKKNLVLRKKIMSNFSAVFEKYLKKLSLTFKSSPELSNAFKALQSSLKLFKHWC